MRNFSDPSLDLYDRTRSRCGGFWPLLLSLAALSACGDNGEGTIVLRVYGESFVEEGIPASVFDDGWAVTFEGFEVTLSDVEIAGTTVESRGPIELTEPSAGAGQALGSVPAPVGDYADAQFTIDELRVSGTAVSGATTKTFSWRLPVETRYDSCETVTAVSDGEAPVFEITIHADHLFYDSAVAEEPQVLFQALADADLDDDGVIDQAELQATDIGAYDPGSGGGVDDLWSFLKGLARTVGHVDGEGHCHATPLG